MRVFPLGVQPKPERSGGQPMLSHPDVCGHFAPHVFGACFAALVRCPHPVHEGEQVSVFEQTDGTWAWCIGKGAA